MNRNGVVAVEKSENAKIGKAGEMSTTYAPIQSCPDSCPFKSSGACYGKSGPISWQWTKNGPGKGGSTVIAQSEAILIEKLSGERPMRLHTLGDCRTPAAARIVAKAAETYIAKHNQPVFTFTHAWRDVPRSAWGKISIIASCETPMEVVQARARGYATALVVTEHRQTTPYDHNGIKVIPCPQQTGKASHCNKCRLCFKADNLFKAGLSIAFHVHGPSIKAGKVLEAKNTLDEFPQALLEIERTCFGSKN